MFAPAALLLQNLAKVQAGITVGLVNPDADILDNRGKLGLAQLGDQDAVGSQVEALELGITCRVVAGQILHALLAENEEGVEANRPHFGGDFVPAILQFILGEVQSHDPPCLPNGDFTSPARQRSAVAVASSR